MSEQMIMVTHTIKGLVQSVNAIAQIMNNQNYTLELPQSGQPPLPIIPTPTLPEQHTPITHYSNRWQPAIDLSPHNKEGDQT